MHGVKVTFYQFTNAKVILKMQIIIKSIKILSCFGKLFTSILNQRINTFLENSGLLSEEQAAFRKGYCTTYHIFSLKMLVDSHLFKEKHLFCAFIEYKKTFDSVDRIA